MPPARLDRSFASTALPIGRILKQPDERGDARQAREAPASLLDGGGVDGFDGNGHGRFT